MSLLKKIELAQIITGNPGIRNDFQQYFRRFNIQSLKSTAQGQLGLQEVMEAQLPCGLFILDVKLADMPCQDYIASIRKEDRFIDTLMVILYLPEEFKDLQAALPLGIFDFTSKPFKIDDLIKKIENRYLHLAKMAGRFQALYNDTTGLYHEMAKDYPQAIIHYKNAVEISENAKSRYDLGRMYTLQGEKKMR